MFSKGFRRIKKFANERPYRFWLTVSGLTLAGLSACILPILGFSAVGPVAGSIAAGWQSSIGLVSVGSLFAFLQSAAMGGAAMAGIVGLVAGGLTIAGLAALTAVPEDRLHAIKDMGIAVGERVQKMGEDIAGIVKRGWAAWMGR